MNAEAVLDLIRALILIFILYGIFRFIGLEKFTTRVVFYTLAVACILFSDLYWLAYDILRPETRMPFAANEIGEGALFLLLGASLNSGRPLRLREAKGEALFAVLFSAANTALWIAWSGEWTKDILAGLAFAYFLCALFIQIRKEEAFSSDKRLLFLILCVILIAGQTATFFVPEAVRRILDLLCYVFLFAVAFFLLAKAVRAITQSNGSSHGVCDTFTAFAWVVVTMYMSEAIFHVIAYALSGLCFLLMYTAIKREVNAL